MHLIHDRIAEKIGADAVAVKMSSTARRGNMFFATTAPLVRPIMEDVLASLNSEGHIKTFLDYASWIDGYEEEGGIKIEQWLEKGIHSPLLDADAVQYIFWNKKGVQKIIASAHGDILQKKHDLFFDCITGQVSVAGEECTSKDLPTQKATAKIMEALLSADGHRLHNRELPESGYAKYRNEFQGKITGPLSALVKSRLKKDLLFKVEGTLTDFWVSFDSEGFDIGIAKKFQ